MRFSWRTVLLAFVIAPLTSVLLGACAAPEVLTSLLGPPVKPQEASGGLRRMEYKPWVEFTMEYDLKAPEKINWVEKLAALPRYEKGDINWVKALNDGLIKPKAGLEDDAPDQDTEDALVTMVPKESPDDKAYYPHLPHTKVLSCKSCHPAIFKKKEGASDFTMAAIKKGQFCGVCHGAVAFHPKDCDLCHVEPAG